MATKSATVKKDVQQNLGARLEDQAAKRERLREAKQEIGFVSSDVQRARNELLEARSHVRAYGGKPDYASLLEEATNRASTAERSLDAAEKRFAALTDEINTLERELGKMRGGGGTTLDELIAHQDAVRSTRSEIARIEALIAERRSVIASAESAAQPPRDLLNRRDNLAAEVALGEAPESSLQEIDAEIAQRNEEDARVRAETQQAVDRAHQAITGLNRVLAEQQAKLARLEERSPEVLAMYLNSLAETIGSEYVEAAKKVWALLVRFTAVSDLLERIPAPNAGALTLYRHGDASLPLIRVKACDGLDAIKHEYFLFSARQMNRSEAKDALLAELRSQGIEV